MNQNINTNTLPPFACTHSPNLPELLMQLNCTIVVSTYQAGKVVLVSATNRNQLVQLPRTFKRAMGIAVKDNKMAIATENEVIILANSKRLAETYPAKPNTYDALYLPRATYYTGHLDMHDLHYGKDALWGVNTSFSCLCKIDSDYSFRPVWKPHFIDKLASEDRCHLNGLAMQDGEPIYISALGTGNTLQSWRDNIIGGGVLMDVASNEIIASGLAMPHAPRLYDGKLYVLLSAKEQLVCVDPATGKYDVVTQVPGFVRGMTKYGEYLFIGTSKLRKKSSTFKHLKISKESDAAGIKVVHLPSGKVVANLNWLSSVDEIYDVQILPNASRPNIINTYTDAHQRALMLPDTTYWSKSTPPQK
ncbi:MULTISPECIES: TIGR03032 family protein [unclassified Aureispira]|uniref:TIGR03032 family protein n=1 Tax=unclassified Aureispira TaxID=2649989 RepID=UPI0006966F4F|nr:MULTISPECIES: TIGR03032 family protein [unclassified Aureispira]WMX13511.1 TIGR03032 family protein [Aureispira sp. CCB-E]